MNENCIVCSFYIRMIVILSLQNFYFSKTKGQYITYLKVWVHQLFFKFSRCYFMGKLTLAHEKKIYFYLGLVESTLFTIIF